MAFLQAYPRAIGSVFLCLFLLRFGLFGAEKYLQIEFWGRSEMEK